ncbi:hypothetical protein H4R18_000675 [Coemansia javaensis]|uniref:Uncharacterized protein n=1 Tax=Coemansia javaensis TaxID=2761396 RepID=A0A9W8LLE0_9FUNG|nr:hypothetical protein H4R18_000675 [Coemansia javaensis]
MWTRAACLVARQCRPILPGAAAAAVAQRALYPRQCVRGMWATRHVQAGSGFERERQRQQAQDDTSGDAAEHLRGRAAVEEEGAEEEAGELAPEVERLDPQTVPGLYPELDMGEEGDEEAGDDSWYVDTEFAQREAAEMLPLWQRRAAENLGPQAAGEARSAADLSLFDLCRATLQEDGEVAVLDVGDRCDWTQHMVVAKAKSTRHMRAMGERLLTAIKARSRELGAAAAMRVDGRESDDWMVVDMGRFVVHIMTPEAHSTYDLESLWTAPRPDPSADYGIKFGVDGGGVGSGVDGGVESGARESAEPARPDTPDTPDSNEQK